jgi:hypothetical protein
LHIVVVTEDNGDYPPFSNSITAQVDYMNSLFTNGMSFYICDIDVENNSSVFNINGFPSNANLYNLNHVDDAINIYYVNSINLGAYAGIASFPWGGQTNNKIFMDINNATLSTLAHEMGHYFGVLHTHQCTGTNNLPNDPDCPGELVDMSNSDIAGDRIIDTGADPGPINSVFTNPDGYCGQSVDCSSTSCFMNGTSNPFLDSNLDEYHPNPKNIMSYYFCADKEFSNKQLELMASTLITHPNRSFLVNSNPIYCELPVGGNIEVYCELVGSPVLEGQKVSIMASTNCVTETNVNGNYQVNQFCPLGFNLGQNIDFTVSPKLYDPSLPYHLNQPGMTAYDLYLIKQHLNGVLLDTPYKRIAADADGNGVINGLDIDEIGSVITGQQLFFTLGGQASEGAAWRFVPSYYLNSDGTFNSNFFIDPFTAVWTGPNGETLSYNSNSFVPVSYMDLFTGNLQNPLFSNNDNWSFRAVKIGDVNCNAPQSPYFNFGSTEPAALARESSVKINTIRDSGNNCLEKGNKGKILFSLSSEDELSSYQFGISIDKEKIKINKVKREDDENFSFDKFNQETLKDGQLKTIWWNEKGELTPFSKDKILFSLEIEALENICDLTDLIKLDREILSNLFYNSAGNPIDANLFVELSSEFLVDNIHAQDLKVNVYPNPSNNQFSFEFEVGQEEEAIITIYDYFGNTIERKITLAKGKQVIMIDDTSNLSHGLLYYKLSINNKIAQGKMIKLK